MTERSWDAGTYHRVSGPLVEMATKVLDRLPLDGDETVMDAGCGTGLVTTLLLERLPAGRVLAVDADASMIAKAREQLAPFGDRVTVEQVDLLALDLDGALDAVLSTATFHWILDHERLFARLFRALRRGGRLVAQCGGHGNIASVLRAADEAAALPQWSDRFVGWSRPSRFATAEETEALLRGAGFEEARCWLEPSPVVPDDPRAYLSTIAIGAHLQRLGDDEVERSAFLDEVLARLPDPVTVDYVRLNIDARKPA
ncbi:MAG TPA: methyltransferase domain-containing protein [Acidimicrobiales bacterium]